MTDRRWDWTRPRTEHSSSPEVRGQGWTRGPPCQTRLRLQREFCSVPRNQRTSPPMFVSFCDPTYTSVKAPHWLIVVWISQKGFEVVQGQGCVLYWRGGQKKRGSMFERQFRPGVDKWKTFAKTKQQRVRKLIEMCFVQLFVQFRGQRSEFNWLNQ